MSFSTYFMNRRSKARLAKYRREVEAINALAPAYAAKSDDQLRAQLRALRQALASGASLSASRAPVFAAVREMSKRVLGLYHHDVQLMGGLALADGRLAEMKTGEGKTLVVTLAAALFALQGKGVHVVTVNAYLAERDAEDLRPLYEALGLTVGVTAAGLSPEEKRAAYACDITYGVNHEFGFDYLRDNMVSAFAQRVQRGQVCAIIDEVDSILIDEARTPLIISGAAARGPDLYLVTDQVVRQLKKGEHFTACEKDRNALLTDAGFDAVEALLQEAGVLSTAKALYASENLGLLKHVNAALLAHTHYARNHRYIVRDDEIVIVDEATGRLMPGRRWPDGLHEAIEAKEGLEIKPETRTQASITYQAFYTSYGTLSGLTGTAMTEAEEFAEIYGLEVIAIPTHRPVLRKDLPDILYRTKKAKYAAIVTDVALRHAKGQPILVGTGSVEESEVLAELFTAEGIPHRVLNARQNAQEAEIIAQAGSPRAVTIATNMAGRGTDIILGGNWRHWLAEDASNEERAQAKQQWEASHAQVVEAGGLHVIGTERHESRRVDLQLQGRAGRQGDPGSSQFYLSLEDTLLRLFAGRASLLFTDADDGLSHAWLCKLVSKAQRTLENRGFDQRRELLRYDNVFSGQRKALYAIRNTLLGANPDELEAVAQDCLRQTITAAVAPLPGCMTQQWDLESLLEACHSHGLFINRAALEPLTTAEQTQEDMEESLFKLLMARFSLLSSLNPIEWHPYVRTTLLSTLDDLWVANLTELETLHKNIHLRAIAQMNPVTQFAKEGFALFEHFLAQWRMTAGRLILNPPQPPAEPEPPLPPPAPEASAVTAPPDTPMPAQGRVRRLAACPCGSGLRHKHCCGRIARAPGR